MTGLHLSRPHETRAQQRAAPTLGQTRPATLTSRTLIIILWYLILILCKFLRGSIHWDTCFRQFSIATVYTLLGEQNDIPMAFPWNLASRYKPNAGRRAAKLGGLWAPGGDLPRKRGAGDQWGAEGSERSGGPGRAGDGPGMSWLHNGLTCIVYFYVSFLFLIFLNMTYFWYYV